MSLDCGPCFVLDPANHALDSILDCCMWKSSLMRQRGSVVPWCLCSSLLSLLEQAKRSIRAAPLAVIPGHDWEGTLDERAVQGVEEEEA